MSETADAIVTALYRRFKDWSKRGFGPDDVTWCEVRADVLALISDHLAKVEARALRAEKDAQMTLVKLQGAEAALARVGELEELLTIWSADGALQTFEDRERFRVAAQAALRPEHPPAQDGGGDV